MAKQDTSTGEEMKAFFYQIVDQAQFKSARYLTTGSTIEVPRLRSIWEAFQLNADSQDVDKMHYDTERYAIPRDRFVPERYKGVVLRIYSDDIHSGYARLLDDRSGLQFKYDDIPRRSDFYDEEPVAHGPAKMFFRTAAVKRSMPSHNSHEFDTDLKYLINSQDRVPAVHCPFWPVEASEWITRTRHHGCPSKSVIKQVVRYGCDFVGVAHKLSPNRNGANEWRFSFSIAEIKIIRSWTDSQRKVYRALRIINNIVQKNMNKHPEQDTVLCTYFFKTLMLWACEQLPQKFWTAASLVETVRHLLISICLSLILRMCPNYFIPKNNMMDHLMQFNVYNEIFHLQAVHADIFYIAIIVNACAIEECTDASERHHVRLPAWIFNSYKIQNRIRHVRDNFKKLFSRRYSATLSAALKSELADIYHALYCHKKAKTDGVGSLKFESNLHDAEQYLFRATSLSESNKFVTFNSRFLMMFISFLFIKYNTKEENAYAVEHKSSNYQLPEGFCETMDSICMNNICKRRLVYNRTETESIDFLISSTGGFRKSEKLHLITMHSTRKTSPTEICEQNNFFRDWPGRSPTVHISWFIAKAYLANLYYTTSHDHQATVSACDDIIQVSQKSYQNLIFAEKCLPVLISTQWTAVYDEEIQAVLGFYSLSAFVQSKAERRFVQLGVCPVQFALYLKLRSCIEYDYWKNYEELLKKYNDHVHKCCMDVMVTKGRRALILCAFLSKAFGKNCTVTYTGTCYRYQIGA